MCAKGLNSDVGWNLLVCYNYVLTIANVVRIGAWSVAKHCMIPAPAGSSVPASGPLYDITKPDIVSFVCAVSAPKICVVEASMEWEGSTTTFEAWSPTVYAGELGSSGLSLLEQPSRPGRQPLMSALSVFKNPSM